MPKRLPPRRRHPTTTEAADASAAQLSRLLILAGILMAAVIAVYWKTLTNPFLFDDELSIVSNGTIRELWRLNAVLSPPVGTPVAGRPVVNLTFALNYAVGALDVRGYHVVNIAIHIYTALVLFGFVRRTFDSPALVARFGERATGLAFAVAMLWALHPLQTEAVNYLTQRTESLMSLFYLLTLYCAVRGLEQGSSRWSLAGAVVCAAGMACKESMVSAPLMLVLHDRVFFFASFRASWKARWPMYAGAGAAWLVLLVLMMPGPRSDSVGLSLGTTAANYLLNQAQMIVGYLKLTVWPQSLILDYGPPQHLTVNEVAIDGVMVGCLIVATIGALAFALPLGFLGAAFFVLLAPTSSIIPIVTEVGAERRMYLPLACLVILGVVAISVAGDRVARSLDVVTPRLQHVAECVILAAVCAWLATGVIHRNRDYETRLTMAETIVERRPHGRARYELATELLVVGRRDDGIAELTESAHDYPGARYALGTELIAAGQTAQGVDQLEQFVRAQPNHANAIPARDMIGQTRISQNRLDDAAAQFEQILRDAPDYLDAQWHLGDVMLMEHRPDAAIGHYAAYVGLRPSNAQAQSNFGIALAATGKVADAVAHFERAVDIDPGSVEMQQRLVRALLQVGRDAEAERRARVLLAGQPGNAAAHTLLGVVLASLDQREEEAIKEFQRALEIAPQEQEARRNLARLQGAGRRAAPRPR